MAEAAAAPMPSPEPPGEVAPLASLELYAAPEVGDATNPLLHKRCSQLGRNRFFEARPATVHFSGFEVGRTASLRLEVLNVAPAAQRLHLVAPQTPQFRVRFEKQGRVAPGMAEGLWIDFAPDAWRYYYDAVRLFCESGETLLVPIHAYPVMNRVALPKRLDFGARALLDDVVKAVTLRCEVPVAFEYEIRVLVTHAQFELLTPPRGVVGAEGRVDVRVRYRPVTLGTAAMRLSVEVSQLDSAPHVLDVVGNAVPGTCLLYTSPSPRDATLSRMPSSA